MTTAATAAAAEASVRGGIWCEGTICVEQMEIRGVCAVYGQWWWTAVGGCACWGGGWCPWWCTTRRGIGGPAAVADWFWCGPLLLLFPEDRECWNRLLLDMRPPLLSLLFMLPPRIFRMLLLLLSCCWGLLLCWM